MDWLKEQTKLRDAALDTLRQSADYRALEALDQAVVAMGGVGVLARIANDDNADRTAASSARPEVTSSRRAVTSLGTAAMKVLEGEGRPLPILSLMAKVQEDGVVLGGKDPLSNFRSSLSRDSRLRSIGKSNNFVWWFADRDLPEGFDEAEPNLLKGLNGSASSISSLEGGDGHGPATTH